MKVYFVDLDGVVVKQGTREFLPNSLEKLQELSKSGEIYYFSCWAFTDSDVEWLRNIPGVKMSGYIRKPIAENYVYIDDLLLVDECKTKL